MQAELPHEAHDLIELCKEQGWTVGKATNGHHRVTPPNGPTIFHSGTASDWRAVDNFRSALKRAGLVPRLEWYFANKPAKAPSETKAVAPPQPAEQKPQFTTAQQLLEQIEPQTEVTDMADPNQTLKQAILKTMEKHDPHRKGMSVDSIMDHIRVINPKWARQNVSVALAGYMKNGYVRNHRSGRLAFYYLTPDAKPDESFSDAIKRGRLAKQAKRIEVNGGKLPIGARTGDKQTDHDLKQFEGVLEAVQTFENEMMLARKRFEDDCRRVTDELVDKLGGLEQVVMKHSATTAKLLQLRNALDQMGGV